MVSGQKSVLSCYSPMCLPPPKRGKFIFDHTELFVYKFYINIEKKYSSGSSGSGINNTRIFMPWITFHGTFQRSIAQDGKYLCHKPISLCPRSSILQTDLIQSYPVVNNFICVLLPTPFPIIVLVSHPTKAISRKCMVLGKY